MNQSEQINELATALAKAQGVIATASKDKKNPFFKSKYADLASVWGACREPLSAHGLSVVQVVETSDATRVIETENRKSDTITRVELNRTYVVTTLLHSSGQWMSGSMECLQGEPGMQPLGSAITYARRYALSAIVGIAPDDDDGNAAQQNHGGAPAQRRTQTPPRQSAKLLDALQDIRAAGSQSELAAVGGSLKGMQMDPADLDKARAAYAAKLNTFGGE